jgi:DNA mismatch endonuclease (patch repair protein)
MSLIKNANTKPELFIRRQIYGMGYRYRLHVKDLPGKPDLVFRSRRKVIFVHGCFWHQHDCGHYRMPKTKLDFWLPKLEKNKKRDAQVRREYIKLGWRILVIWECQLGKEAALRKRIRRFLEAK